MNPTLRGGLVLGILVVLWTFSGGVLGWYRDPNHNLRFVAVAILIQVGVLVWTLRATQAYQGYLRQLASGVAASVLASALIFGGSLLFSTLASQPPPGVNEAPVATAFAGVIGTWFTGLLVTLVASIWLRKKLA